MYGWIFSIEFERSAFLRAHNRTLNQTQFFVEYHTRSHAQYKVIRWLFIIPAFFDDALFSSIIIIIGLFSRSCRVVIRIDDILMKFIHRLIYAMSINFNYNDRMIPFVPHNIWRRKKSCSLISSKYLFWFWLAIYLFIFAALWFEHNYWKLLQVIYIVSAHTQLKKSITIKKHNNNSNRIVLNTWLSFCEWVCERFCIWDPFTFGQIFCHSHSISSLYGDLLGIRIDFTPRKLSDFGTLALFFSLCFWSVHRILHTFFYPKFLVLFSTSNLMGSPIKLAKLKMNFIFIDAFKYIT